MPKKLGRWAFGLLTALALCLLFSRLPRGALSNQLVLQFDTGTDDLTGGYNNIDVALLLKAEPPLWFRNVNAHHGFERHSTNTVHCTLPLFITRSDIVGIRLQMTSKAGTDLDGWNLGGFRVTARVNETTHLLLSELGNPWVRLTSQRDSMEVRFAPRPPRAAPPEKEQTTNGNPNPV